MEEFVNLCLTTWLKCVRRFERRLSSGDSPSSLIYALHPSLWYILEDAVKLLYMQMSQKLPRNEHSDM